MKNKVKGKGKEVAGKGSADKRKGAFDDDKTGGVQKRNKRGVLQLFLTTNLMPRQEGWTCQIRARVAGDVSSLKRKCWPETNFFEFWAFRCRPCLNEPVSPVFFLDSLTCKHETSHLWRVSRLSQIILKKPRTGVLRQVYMA